MKQWIQRWVPSPCFSVYHFLLAVLAKYSYGNPSRGMIVIGVTGTSGKSTVIEFLQSILEETGSLVGVASTIKFNVGGREYFNNKKMTMVGRFQLQKLLFQMKKNQCRYALVETTSEGIRQYRHWGVHYDIGVLTNLYPEHIESHGSFENYRREKLKLFQKIAHSSEKVINGSRILRTMVVNGDDENAPLFLSCPVPRRIVVTLQNRQVEGANERISAKALERRNGFRVHEGEVLIHLPGRHNIMNALLAYGVGFALGINFDILKRGIERITSLPGRQEFIRAGQPFEIIVDYAFEPVALQKLYDVVASLKKRRQNQSEEVRVIHVLGTTGGGRDRSRGKVLGEMAGRFADIVIATNEDPYDDDPEELARRVVHGAQDAGKKMGENLFLELDRRQAIRKALRLAREGDIVLITGKGCEQAIVEKGRMIPWDDRRVVLEELKKLQVSSL